MYTQPMEMARHSAPAPRTSVRTEAPPVDMARFLTMVDDDPKILREMATMYLVESTELMNGLHAALETGDIPEAERLAHKLGGSSATCGMLGIVTPLRELELSGKARNSQENEKLLKEADRQHERICAYLVDNVLSH